MLPREEEAKCHIANAFRSNFQRAQQVLQLGYDAIGCNVRAGGGGSIHFTGGKGLRDHTFYLSLALFAKTCKQLRAIIALCELGLAEEADPLARSLFEAMLALHFLLKPRVVLRENGKKVPPIKAKPLTAELRTWLYLAHSAFEAEKQLSTFRNTAGLKRLAKHLGDPAVTRRHAQDAAKKIGPEWTKRLRDRRSYAGISVKALAESFGVLPWYNSVYGIQCGTTHARDAIKFIDLDSAPTDFRLDLGPNCEGIDAALKLACAVFLAGLAILDKRLGLGVERKIDTLWEQFG